MVLGQYFPHIETNQLICTKNQFTGLYVTEAATADVL